MHLLKPGELLSRIETAMFLGQTLLFIGMLSSRLFSPRFDATIRFFHCVLKTTLLQLNLISTVGRIFGLNLYAFTLDLLRRFVSIVNLAVFVDPLIYVRKSGRRQEADQNDRNTYAH